MLLSAASLPANTTYFQSYSVDGLPGFDTIDGGRVSQQAGELALRRGLAMLVGGLLVGWAGTNE